MLFGYCVVIRKRIDRMKKELEDKHFIKKPYYPGGTKAMQEFLRKNKKYPPKALEAGIEGTVHIRYTINYKGVVVKTHVIAGLGYGCDEEAERVVRLLKFKVPRTRKVKAQFHKTVHIHFKIPPRKMSQTKFVYETSESKKAEDTKNDNDSYSYQITW